MSKTLRLILGDQLNSKHSWFITVDESVTYVMMEIRSETDYATHHIQKIVGIFSAMKEFSNYLCSEKHQVIYIHLNDKNNFILTKRLISMCKPYSGIKLGKPY